MHDGLRHVAGAALRRGSALLARPFVDASRRSFGIIRSVATERSLIALTFDDGPHPYYTPALLDILARYDARATLFMVGELAAKYPAVVLAAARQGHAIANHSWGHVSFPLLTVHECREQLRRCEGALSPYGVKLFRPPYCHQTVRSRWHALRAGYDVVGFSVHAEDWLPRSAPWMTERLIRQARPGAIVILHDNIYRSVLPLAEHDRGAMLLALDGALEQLQEKFRFVTVPELLRDGRPVREHRYQRGLPDMQPALQRCVMEQRGEIAS